MYEHYAKDTTFARDFLLDQIAAHRVFVCTHLFAVASARKFLLKTSLDLTSHRSNLVMDEHHVGDRGRCVRPPVHYHEVWDDPPKLESVATLRGRLDSSLYIRSAPCNMLVGADRVVDRLAREFG